MANIDPLRDALEVLRDRFQAAGRPGGEFYPRQIRPSAPGGWWKLVCVDTKGVPIRGIKAVHFRPTVTVSADVPFLGERNREDATLPS